MKYFKQDIIKFKEKIESKENFSFSKYADGEWAVIQNHNINNKEFWFDPNNELDQVKRDALIRSFQYQNPRYHVGISCPCCQGLDTFESMRRFSLQPDDRLTWANIWVNGNYSYYVYNIVPLFSQRPVVLFCNENGKIENLPFVPYVVFRLKHNAWEYNWDIVNSAKTITSQLKAQGLSNLLFLFCCGPFGNILCHQLTEHEPENTYLDIGSTLNPWLQSAGFDRHYYMGDNIFSRMECVWNQ
jgi:hypothetical protein